jgi:hypothetical protein
MTGYWSTHHPLSPLTICPVSRSNAQKRRLANWRPIRMDGRRSAWSVIERDVGAVPERAGPTPASYAGRGDRSDMGPAFGDTVAEWRERQVGRSGGHGW